MLVFAYKQSEGEMKKAIVFVLIAIIAVSSAFAFKFNSVGIETGGGALSSLFASVDMEIMDRLDVYARLGYTGYFNISGGAQYQVAEIKAGSTKLPCKVGGQMGFNFADGMFAFELIGTFEISFSTGNFGAFIRPGLGLAVASYEYYDYYRDRYAREAQAAFDWKVETGVAYLFN